MSSFMSANRTNILKAFTLAHRCAENQEIGDKERKIFRAIAYEIWKAVGENGAPPKVLPPNMEAIARKSLAGVLRDDDQREEKPETGAQAEAAGRKAYEEATRDVD